MSTADFAPVSGPSGPGELTPAADGTPPSDRIERRVPVVGDGGPVLLSLVMRPAAPLSAPGRLLWIGLLVAVLGLSACGGDDQAAEGETGAGETTAAPADGADAGASEGTDPGTAPPTTSAPTTTTTTVPLRRMGVVLLAPDEPNNSLNVRAGPGTRNAKVSELAPAQAELVPTGGVEVVDGRVWHELMVGELAGWVYGYYLTETWTPAEVEGEWDWRSTIDSFANALVLGEGLEETVSWRGLFVIHFDDNLRRWTPEELPGLHTDDTDLDWSNTGASADESDATVGTWKEVIADAFLSDYLDQDVNIEVGGLTLGPNSTLPETAVSSAFANFPWVAIHDPGDDEGLGGLDWSTWLVFLEMEDDGPRVVGIQPQAAYP